MQSGVSGKVSGLALLVSEYDISISFVKGMLNKAADGLPRAYDDGLTKYDDLITARHPALGLLSAPKPKEGEDSKLNDYLAVYEGYLSEHWPKVLRDFEIQQASEEKTPDINCFKDNMGDMPRKLSRMNNIPTPWQTVHALQARFGETSPGRLCTSPQ